MIKFKKYFSTLFTKSNNKKGLENRIFLYKDKELLHKCSFWHDLHYHNKQDNTYNTVIEIPKGQIAKYEMSRETYNPIKQDTKKNKITKKEYLRYYKLTPIFNYGFIPRTWENNKVEIIENFKGDNDPIDVVELSDNKIYHTGQIIKTFIVGAFCLIDEGEIDWKILAVDSGMISYEESLNYLKNEKNVEKIREIQKWFKIYKTFDGKKENVIYGNDKIFDVKETEKIIEENHQFYKDLINCK